MTHDLLGECNRQGIPEQEFEATFCSRCRQRACGRAAWGSDLLDKRIANQEQRLLHPTQVDPTLSKYAHLADFADMMHRAVQMEIANRRGDWEVPEIPITDGQVEVKSPDMVDAAVRAMRVPADYGGTVEAHPDIVAEGLPDPSTPIITEPEPPAPAPAAPQPEQPKRFVPPRGANAPTQQGAVIGGGPPPPSPQAAPAPTYDPWAPPPGATPTSGKPKIRKVPVGGTVKMGGESK